MKTRFFIILWFISSHLLGQNLVPNNSFENYNTCPDDYSTNRYINFISVWDSPNLGSPDYFNACSYKCGVPLNWVGSAEAYDGDAYMGIICCMQQIDRNQIAYREYIRVQLTDTLKTGVAYFASMQIRLGLSCNICCNGLGMYFSSEALNSRIKSNYPVKPQVEYKNNLIIADKEKWTQVCGTFRASGNENYLIIGNFLSNQQMKYQVIDENLLQTQHTTPSAYYYIDNVEVIEYNDTLQLDCDGLVNKVPLAFKGELNRDTKWVLKNLYFDVDKAIILEESFYELDQLAAEMKSKVNYKINICGHTDNTGTADHNQQLSENRALAVRNYLLNKGISKFRMSFKGFGDTQPIAENNTKEGKQLNRRVEIEVF